LNFKEKYAQKEFNQIISFLDRKNKLHDYEYDTLKNNRLVYNQIIAISDYWRNVIFWMKKI